MNKIYIPKSLSSSDKKKQLESIRKQTIRPKVDYPYKKSKWTKKAEEYFKGDTSIENISKTINVPVKGLKEIIKKGEKAYFTSGSRPNVNPTQWGIARLYSLLFGTPKLRQMDKGIIDKYNIPILKGGNLLNPTVEDIQNKKQYFDNDLEEFFNLICFNRDNFKILGSYELKSFFYPADIDIIEKVNISNLSSFIKALQNKIKEISKLDNIYIMDIKMGSIKNWEVVDETSYIEKNKIYGYNPDKSKEKLKELLKQNIISKEEYNKWSKMLINKPNDEELQIIKKEVRPNLLRWSSNDIIKGYINHRGYKITIRDAIITGGLNKFDFILIKQDKMFVDINIVYDIREKNIRNEKAPLLNPKKELLNEVKTLKSKGSYFKALKRLFSYYKITNNNKQLLKLYKILNSDLGILHQISSNIELLLLIIESNKKIKITDMKIFIDSFIDRLNMIFTIKEYFKNEKYIINKINNIIKTKSIKVMKNKLENLKNKLDDLKNSQAKKYI